MTPPKRPRLEPIGLRAAREAQSWVGTPVIGGQSQKGQGTDCKGLLAGVARELDLPEAASFYAKFVGYRLDRDLPAQLLREGLQSLFDRVDLKADSLRDGDVLLLELNHVPVHLAIATCDATRAVHADGPTGKVRERQLAAMVKVYRLNSAWRWRKTRGGRNGN